MKDFGVWWSFIGTNAYYDFSSDPRTQRDKTLEMSQEKLNCVRAGHERIH